MNTSRDISVDRVTTTYTVSLLYFSEPYDIKLIKLHKIFCKQFLQGEVTSEEESDVGHRSFGDDSDDEDWAVIW